MAETAATVIKDALQEILLQASEAPVEAVDEQQAIRYLNRMMSAYAINGINLGFTKITNAADEVTVADGAVEGIVYNLAVKLASGFDMPISQALYANARETYLTLLVLGVNIEPSQFGGTLPTGSGNEGDVYDEHFFSDSLATAARLTLTTNTTNTVITTADTPVLIQGTWAIAKDDNITATTAGRLTLTNDLTVNVKCNIYVAPISGTETLSLYIAVNGQAISRTQHSQSITSSTYMETRLNEPLHKGDYIEVFVSNDTATTDLLVSTAELTL